MSVCDIENTLACQGKGDLDITVNGNTVSFAWVIFEIFNLINKAMCMFIHRSKYWKVLVAFKNFVNS